jgi:hypothetical protein
MTNIIEFKKSPLKSQQEKLRLISAIIETIEKIDKAGDIDKLKKSQTIRIKSQSGNDYIFTITRI